jgi:two-component system NtrC family sensor kinase
MGKEGTAREEGQPPLQSAVSGSQEEIEERAERAFLSRPGISIRARITLGFLIFFVLISGVIITMWITLLRIEKRLHFLELADNYTFEIQQARRFEKNYFLYGTNLADVQAHIETALRILTDAGEELSSIMGGRNFDLLRRNITRYQDLIRALVELDRDRPPGVVPQHRDIEARLREHGAEMVSTALDLAGKERRNVQAMLRLFKRLPILFLAVLFPLIIYSANFLARQIVQPLSRLMDITKRIASGDFTPITPHRRYRDEFSNLNLAMNRMMHELARRQEILVQSHKLRAVGTLTAGIAHELNNPINNITLTAEMLKEDYPGLSDGERLDMVNDLVTQAERSQRIVRNLLEFARESEIKSEPLNLEDLLGETVMLASNQVKIHRARVHTSIAGGLPPVQGDRHQLSQVFLNLILNALDAFPPGGGALTVTAERSERPGYLAVKVMDTGKGIPESILPAIFDPFFTTKPTGKGTGLGLSVSLGIVRKHGGDILVSSTVGAGSTFTVLLPVACTAPIGDGEAGDLS